MIDLKGFSGEVLLVFLCNTRTNTWFSDLRRFEPAQNATRKAQEAVSGKRMAPMPVHVNRRQQAPLPH
jgi:hypothetical protein